MAGLEETCLPHSCFDNSLSREYHVLFNSFGELPQIPNTPDVRLTYARVYKLHHEADNIGRFVKYGDFICGDRVRVNKIRGRECSAEPVEIACRNSKSSAI
jgi:hypothetical protein